MNAIYYDAKTQRIFIGSQLSGLFVLTRKKFSTLASPYPDTDQVYYGQTLIDPNTVLSNQGIAYTSDRAREHHKQATSTGDQQRVLG